MDLNKPIVNPSLIISLEKLGEDYNQMNEHDFFKELLGAKFLAPVIIDPASIGKDGEAVLNEYTNIQLLNIKDTNGHIYLPAFTDWEELKKWSTEDVQTLIFVSLG